MKKPHKPRLSTEEMVALRTFNGVAQGDSKSIHWYQARVDIALAIALSYILILLVFFPQLSEKMAVPPELVAMYRSYFVCRGLIALSFVGAGIWAWVRNCHPAGLQGMWAVTAAVTLCIDWVVVYSQVPISGGFYFTASLFFRPILIVCLAWNWVQRAHLPPMNQRKLFGVRLRPTSQ
jgi:hypothetical protein